MKTQNSITINEREILIFSENGENYIAIKPICEALGVSVQGQLERLNNDEILASTIKLCFTVGADGKNREMSVIPYKYVFGWLFTINANNVKLESKEALIKYKMECYNALYDRFTSKPKKIYEKLKLDYELRQLESELDDKLETDPLYIKIQELKSEKAMLEKQIRFLDSNEKALQQTLFDNEIGDAK